MTLLDTFCMLYVNFWLKLNHLLVLLITNPTVQDPVVEANKVTELSLPVGGEAVVLLHPGLHKLPETQNQTNASNFKSLLTIITNKNIIFKNSKFILRSNKME